MRDMASIRKHGGRWRAQVQRNGIRRSRIFQSKREAQDWAAFTEKQISDGARQNSTAPFSDALRRYMREVSPSKRGHAWEVLQIERLLRGTLAGIPMKDLTPDHFSAWRDDRSRHVSAGTIRRERNLISAILNTAIRDWGMLRDNPMRSVKMPPEPRPRDRLPTLDEMERLAHAAGSDLNTATARAFHAFRFACETAMRAGEIVGLTLDDIDREARVARLARTKNGHPRDVPLSSAAMKLLDDLPPMSPVFGLRSDQLDALFRKIKVRAMVDGLHFHDSRAAALTMLSHKVDVMTLARISGHRDLRILMNTYYRESAADIAKRLD